MEPLVRKEAAALEKEAGKPHNWKNDRLGGRRRRLVTHQGAICEQLDTVPLADVCHAIEWPEVDERKLCDCGGARDQGRGSRRRPGLECKLHTCT